MCQSNEVAHLVKASDTGIGSIYELVYGAFSYALNKKLKIGVKMFKLYNVEI